VTDAAIEGYRKSVLPNRLRIVTDEVPHLSSAAIGFWVSAGSKHELDSEAGISHFTEHMLFKGTQARTAAELSCAIESVGAQMGAETDKEYTCFSTRVLSEHSELALEIISDMLCNSLLAPGEFERERGVLLDEIGLYIDSPDELSNDLMVEALWGTHPLGRPIIGRAETISKISREQVRRYVAERYTACNMVISAAGCVSHEAFCDQLARHFNPPTAHPHPLAISEPNPDPHRLSVARDCEQSYFCFGLPGYKHTDDRKYSLGVLDIALGRGSSSRLFREIREERGLAYSIGSYSVSYREGGYLAITGGCAPGNLETTSELITKELKKIVADGPTDAELERARNQIRVGLTFSKDSTGSRMAWIGRGELCYDRYVPYDEVINKVSRVRRSDVIEAARDIFAGGSWAIATVGPA
jgi:predicted Zn-dependent peptidase